MLSNCAFGLIVTFSFAVKTQAKLSLLRDSSPGIPAENTKSIKTIEEVSSNRNCADKATCKDTWECSLKNELGPLLRPEMHSWAAGVCKRGAGGLIEIDHEKMWFDNCCRSCCDLPYTETSLKIVSVFEPGKPDYELKKGEKWAGIKDVKHDIDLAKSMIKSLDQWVIVGFKMQACENFDDKKMGFGSMGGMSYHYNIEENDVRGVGHRFVLYPIEVDDAKGSR